VRNHQDLGGADDIKLQPHHYGGRRRRRRRWQEEATAEEAAAEKAEATEQADGGEPTGEKSRVDSSDRSRRKPRAREKDGEAENTVVNTGD